MADLSVLEDELKSIDSELEAVKFQIQELLERQEELVQKKTVLNNKIKQLSEDDGAESSTGYEFSTKAWNKRDFPWSEKIQNILQTVFKLCTFRPLQLETINATLAKKDIFLIMPTGGGKSLCFQLPALCSEGFTLVICPLVSLMEDQIMVLEKFGVSAVSLNASSTKEHTKWVLDAMIDKASQLRLLYVTPEKIAKSKMLMSRLEKSYNAGTFSRIAVDEVHCCSQWGHDFRPDYKLLGILKRQFPNVPLIGLTATATNHVLQDAQKILCVQKCITFTASFNRPNLFYEVRQKPSITENFIEDILKIINRRYKGQSGIIYCFSQKDSEQVTICLQKRGISAGAYHANLDPKEKTKVHKRWATNEIQVVVATIAFGMGIHKSNVRFVIHHSMSKSMENYYQESGRAGRDDQKADCILYYGFADLFRISAMVVMENVGQKKLYEMVSYCLNLNGCRRVLLAHHFDEVWDSTKCNGMCDNCYAEKCYEKMDITSYCKDLVKILEQADQLNEKLTPLKLLDAWLGRGAPKLRVSSIEPPNFTRIELERIVAYLILQQYLREDFSFTAYATISYLKRGPKVDLLKNKEHSIILQMSVLKNSSDKIKSPTFSPEISATPEEGNSLNAQEKSMMIKEANSHKRPQPDCSITSKKSKTDNNLIVID
uniref:ATP-dependent DNA helicase n=1 Tax=Geotrypetes seraphini TaxID=260995 RepID=A0A6P8RRD8_GEOSA|nr:ATP-dependent DNA helicase Q1 [Geotrypetes seraphini]XP_033808155.1 ATP-dependent DNA helicase Q1 [Geotrypetes seraphini]XP_033808156.1 ATP-dependent DNA helicase Q1 [Geotrypetes seraphini]XP_033808157.1 ATP-dependent DNA helicase Q1 [Geotrypetes seraphini]XP_033808158.1 ATP-dependent DNA helicase Q1 [Geotrypetes seraphini]